MWTAPNRPAWISGPGIKQIQSWKWHLDLSRLYPSARQRGFNEAAERGPLAPVRPSGAGTSVYIVQATREPTRLFVGCSFLSRSPWAQRLSIMARILPRRSSTEAVDV